MGTVRKPEIQNFFQLGSAAAEAGNHEEAYSYFTRVLEADPTDAEAWFGKAVAAGWHSNLRGNRLAEMTAGMDKALQLAGDDRQRMAQQAAAELLSVVTAFFTLSSEHTREFISVDSSWPEHIERCLVIISALGKVSAWVPDNTPLLEAKLTIIDALLTGMEYQEDDEGHYSYLHVSDELRSRLQTQRADAIAKIQALDPSFVAEEIKPVQGPGCGCQIVVVLLVVAVAIAVIVFLMKLSQG